MRPARILLCVVVLAFGGGIRAEAKPDVEALTRRWFGDRAGAASVAYIDREGVTFAGAGRFGPDDPRSPNPDTTFEIGSVSKVFVSLLLVESEKAGKVSREDPAAKYLLPADDPD